MTEQEVVSKLKDYAAIINSLYSAGVVRTYNSPVGDYAEWIVSTKLNLLLEKTVRRVMMQLMMLVVLDIRLRAVGCILEKIVVN